IGYSRARQSLWGESIRHTTLVGNCKAQRTLTKIHPTQVTTWKRQAIDGLTGVFSDKAKKIEDN
ncbi:hypothetical protein, partial [Celeribacter sp.]|uniref:hypothetical protein n=1 Tax=Celeribacter sp. TaxID=1890673 RepID=UPI003A9519C1